MQGLPAMACSVQSTRKESFCILFNSKLKLVFFKKKFETFTCNTNTSGVQDWNLDKDYNEVKTMVSKQSQILLVCKESSGLMRLIG